MKTSIVQAALACSLLVAASTSFADCAADATVADVQRLYAAAQKFELDGRSDRAFRAYIGAQQHTCDPNPVAVPAAQRAAILGLELGDDAEKNGAFDRAFATYEEAGRYAAADRALMSLLRTRPDDPSLFERALRTLEDRSTLTFARNNQMRLQVTGKYAPDPRNLLEVAKMPAAGMQRALAREAALLNDDYLNDYVRVVQARPNDPTDAAARQASMNLQQLFVRKWPGDLLKASRQEIDLARSWTAVTTDAGQRVQLAAQFHQRIEQRVAQLTRSYSGAPALLETARDYLKSAELADRDGRIAGVRNLAARLGDSATTQQRLSLAADYYDVAGQSDKATAARGRMQQLATSKLQATFAQVQRDPAVAMKKNLEQQQFADKQANEKKTDDASKELGI